MSSLLIDKIKGKKNGKKKRQQDGQFKDDPIL